MCLNIHVGPSFVGPKRGLLQFASLFQIPIQNWWKCINQPLMRIALVGPTSGPTVICSVLRVVFIWLHICRRTPRPTKQHPLFCPEKYGFYKNKMSTLRRNFLHEGIWLDENIQCPYVTIEWSLSDCHHSHICCTSSQSLSCVIHMEWYDWMNHILLHSHFVFDFVIWQGQFHPFFNENKNLFLFCFCFCCT